MAEPAAMKSDSTDRDTLRKMCDMRGIKYKPQHKAPGLRKKIDEYEVLHQSPEQPKDKVEVANTGFANDQPQTPDWATLPEPAKTVMDVSKPAAAETFTRSNHELPPPVADALKWLASCSIGRTNIIKRYIESLHG